jgi:hypothetical protein
VVLDEKQLSPWMGQMKVAQIWLVEMPILTLVISGQQRNTGERWLQA